MKSKKIITLTILALLFNNICNSQNLNLDFVNQLTTIPIEKINELLINGFGFEKFNENETNKFIKLDKEKPNSSMYVQVIKSEKFERNGLDIKIGKDYSIKKLKNSLAENSYVYKGTKNGLTIYMKEKMMFLIANEPNEIGATQILVTYIE
jgi:hypothetical protein